MLARIIVLIIALSSGFASAAPKPAEAAELIGQSFQESMTALREHHDALRDNPQLTKELMLEILGPHVDFELLSRLVLAQHWRSATAEERQRFVAAFRNSLIDTYAAALATHMDQVLAVLDSGGLALTVRRLLTGDDPRRVGVRTSLDFGERPVAIDFLLIARGERWLIYDVVIEGISFAASRRSEFAGLLQRQTLAQVIDRLEARDDR